MGKIHYTSFGHGPVVLLLHGFCEDHNIWNNFSQKLAFYCRFLCPDLPGFGKSDPLEGSYSIDQVATRLVEWLEELDIKEFIPIGHSLGGYVTLALVEHFREKILRYGLFHSTAFADSEEKKKNRLKSIEFIKENGVERFVKLLIPSLFSEKNLDRCKDHIQTMVDRAQLLPKETVIAYTHAMKNRPDRSQLLTEEGISKLFIAGKEDIAVPYEQSARQIEIASNTKIFVLEDVGHMGMFESPKLCIKVIKDFL